MLNHQKLSDQVDKGDVKLYLMLSLFRSHSTALTIGLCEAPELLGQLSEPFHHENLAGRSWDHIPSNETDYRSFDTGCGAILSKLDALNDDLLDSDSKVTSLLIKEMSAHLIEDELVKLSSLVKDVIVTIRDPKLEGLSLLTRLANDCLATPHENDLAAKDVVRLLSKSTDIKTKYNILDLEANPSRRESILKLVGKASKAELTHEDVENACATVVDITVATFKITWNNLDHYVSLLKKDSTVNLVIVNGSTLTDQATARQTLIDVTENIDGLSFSDDMLWNWHTANATRYKSSVEKHLGDKAHTNAWTGPAIQSRQFGMHTTGMPDNISLVQFPKALAVEVKKMEPVYQRLEAQSVHHAPEKEAVPAKLGKQFK